MRAAFITTLDSLLRYSLDPQSTHGKSPGFMGCFPMLDGMAPQIQMECLFNTWAKFSEPDAAPELIDDLVLYAAYETLASMASDKSSASLKVALKGPDNAAVTPDHWIYSKSRSLQIAAPGTAGPHFLRELAQIADPNPFFDSGTSIDRCEKRDELTDLVGRWVAHKTTILGSSGLLTTDEQDILREFFEEHPGLVR